MKATILRLVSVFCIMMVVKPLQAQKKLLRGVVTDSVTMQPVSMAGIRNINSGNTALTRRDGSFNIDVSKGQIIAITSNGFYTDTLTVTDSILSSLELAVKLKPLPSTLQDVTISATYNQYQLDSMTRRRYFLQTVGEKKIDPVSRPNDDKNFGIALNLDHFSKQEKNKREARSLFEITEQEAYINYRWNQDLVMKYTSFRDEELANFMQKARPSYDWLRKHENEEDLLYYINSQLKKYKK